MHSQNHLFAILLHLWEVYEFWVKLISSYQNHFLSYSIEYKSIYHKNAK